jgi:hypothetical protein
MEMAKRLWIATVEHESVPATQPALFFQAKEPSDRAIKRRFSDVAKPSQLIVTGVLDLSHAAKIDVRNRKAIEAFDDANTRKAWAK